MNKAKLTKTKHLRFHCRFIFSLDYCLSCSSHCAATLPPVQKVANKQTKE